MDVNAVTVTLLHERFSREVLDRVLFWSLESPNSMFPALNLRFSPVQSSPVPRVDISREQVCALLDACRGYDVVAIQRGDMIVCWEHTPQLVENLRRAVGLRTRDDEGALLGHAELHELIAAIRAHVRMRTQIDARLPVHLPEWIEAASESCEERAAQFVLPVPLAPLVDSRWFYPDQPHAKLLSFLGKRIGALVSDIRNIHVSLFGPNLVQSLSAAQPTLPFLLASLACAQSTPLRVGPALSSIPSKVWSALLEHYVAAQFLAFCRNEDELQRVLAPHLQRNQIRCTRLTVPRLDAILENTDSSDIDELLMPETATLSRRSVACMMMATSSDSSTGHSSNGPWMDEQRWATTPSSGASSSNGTGPSQIRPVGLPLPPYSVRVTKRQRWREIPSRQIAFDVLNANGGAHLQLLIMTRAGQELVVLTREDQLEQCVEHYHTQGYRIGVPIEEGRALRLRIELSNVEHIEAAAELALAFRADAFVHDVQRRRALFCFTSDDHPLFLDHRTMLTYAKREVRRVVSAVLQADVASSVQLNSKPFCFLVPFSVSNVSIQAQLFHPLRSVTGLRCYHAYTGNEVYMRVLPGTRGRTRVLDALPDEHVCDSSVETRTLFRSFYYQPVNATEQQLNDAGTPCFIYSSPNTLAVQHSAVIHCATMFFTLNQASLWAAGEWRQFAERLWIVAPERMRDWFVLAAAALNQALTAPLLKHRAEAIAQRRTPARRANQTDDGASTHRYDRSIQDMPGTYQAPSGNLMGRSYIILPSVVNSVVRHSMELSEVQAEALVLLRHIDEQQAASYGSWARVGCAAWKADNGGAVLAAAFRVWSRISDPSGYLDADHGMSGRRWPGFRPGRGKVACQSSGLHKLRSLASNIDYSSLSVADCLEWFAVQHKRLFGEEFPRDQPAAVLDEDAEEF